MAQNQGCYVEPESGNGMIRALLVLAGSLALAGLARAESRLPLIVDADFQDLRGQCKRLLEGMDAFKVPFPADKAKALQVLLRNGGKDAEAAVVEIQKLLDPLCLVAISINPESRVKATRGPAKAELGLNQEKIVLIKLHNEAGVTHAL